MGFRTIEELCEELKKKRVSALAGGREKAIAKQKAKGKGTARERIGQLLDPGSFVEIDEYVTHRCVNFGLDKNKPLGDRIVTGWGTIDGRKVFVFSWGAIGSCGCGDLRLYVDRRLLRGAAGPSRTGAK